MFITHEVVVHDDKLVPEPMFLVLSACQEDGIL